MLLTAIVFYALMAGAALAWTLLSGRSVWVLDAARSSWTTALVGAAVGLGVGLVVVLLSRASVAHTRWGRALYDWFAELLGALRWQDALIMAGASALGEEMLFRGALQPVVGWPLATLIFGLAHLPPRLALWPWTCAALLLGVVFALGAKWSGNLALPIVAHGVINGLNLHHVGRHAR